MLISLVALALFGTASVGSVSDQVLGALNEADCPRLFGMYDADMRKAVPKENTAKFCNGVREAKGALQTLESVGTEGPWQLYTLHAERGDWLLKVAVNGKQEITGITIVEPAPPAPEVRDTRNHLRWPLDEPTLVAWGGDTEATNLHVKNPQQRRAVDLTMAGADGKTHRNDGHHNDDYLTFGKAVVAVAPGTVVLAVDGVPDNEPGDVNKYYVPGNLVMLDHGSGEYAWYAHLKNGSVRAKPGQKVKAGEFIGLVGNSGNSTEPHLHFHIQDSPTLSKGYGVALVFADMVVVRDGRREEVAVYRPLKGDQVSPRRK